MKLSFTSSSWKKGRNKEMENRKEGELIETLVLPSGSTVTRSAVTLGYYDSPYSSCNADNTQRWQLHVCVHMCVENDWND